MGNLDVKTLLNKNEIFTEFKGALTEQYVFQQLVTQKDMPVYYWSQENARSEIDFLLQIAGQIVPLEVKAKENLQSKSLRVYRQKFEPKTAIRASMSDFREEDWLINLPLYAINEVKTLNRKG